MNDSEYNKGVEYEDLIFSIAESFTNNPLENRKWIINKGKNNKVSGISGFEHQIDVSLENDEELLLIECKNWSKKIGVEHYLTLLGRHLDISDNKNKKKVRAALISKSGFQSGVKKLARRYRDRISIFQANSHGEIIKKLHTAYINGNAKISIHAKGNIIDVSKRK